jgi:signal transduction histidine kinase
MGDARSGEHSTDSLQALQGAEQERLQALRRLNILYTPGEKTFDQIVQYAALLCGCPMGYLTLVDQDKLFFKAQHGTDYGEVDRSGSFCDYAIGDPGLTLIEDARTHPHFFNHPIVTGPAQMRFYAAAPLTDAASRRIGTLCVSDTVTRQLTSTQQDGLRMLADFVMAQMQVRRQSEEQKFLQEAARALTASMDYRATLSRVAWLTVPYLADWCVVHIVEADGSSSLVDAAHATDAGKDFALAAMALRGADAALVKPGTQPGAHRSTQGASTATGDAVSTVWASEAVQHLAAPLGIHSITTVPLVARGRVLGLLTLLGNGPRAHFESTHTSLAQEFTHRAAVAVDNARLYSEAQQAVALRDEFMSIAAHELRTPLTALFLQNDGLLRTLNRHEAQFIEAARRKLPRMRTQMDRLATLVEELLTVSRIQTAPLTVTHSQVDLAQLSTAVVQRFVEPAQRAGSTLTCIAPQPLVGLWDRSGLEQVLTNLLTNAIRYGLGKPIEVRLEAVGGAAQLSVQDQGIGIAAEHHDHIFERFSRMHSMRNYGGLGLGLWIVRQVVEKLGGVVEVHSVPDKGALFVVRLPLLPEQEVAETSADLPQP